MQPSNLNVVAMDWYYSDESFHKGPISEQEIGCLIAEKIINGDTLVWNETFATWKKLNESSLASLLERRYAPKEVASDFPKPPPLIVEPITNPPETYSTSASPHPPSASEGWFYMQNGERNGPVSEEALALLIGIGTLNAKTQVWHPSLSGWQDLSATTFAQQLLRPTPRSTPSSPVDNTLVWILAFCPLLAIALTPINSNLSWVVSLGINLALSYWDDSRLAKTGFNTAVMGSSSLIPIYLWKRASILKQNNAYFWSWCVCFVLSVTA